MASKNFGLISPSTPKAKLTIPVSGSVYVGIGYDPRTNSTRNRAIIKDPVETPIQSIRPEYIFEYVDSYSLMAKTLSVSLSAAYGAEGVSGGSASLRVFKNTTIEQSSAYVIFRMRMITKEVSIETANLVENALDLVNKKQIPSLIEKYGTHFSRSVRYGGELAAILEFSSSSQSSKENLHSEIKAAVGAAHGAANAEQAILNVTSDRRVKITYAQAGGGTGSSETGIITITKDALLERIRIFQNEVKGSNGLDGSTVALEADFASLREADNWPDAEKAELDQPYPPEIEAVAATIDLLNEKLSVVEEILSEASPAAPGVKSAAQEMKPYLQYLITKTQASLVEAMSTPSSEITITGESFFQYRIRNMLGVASTASHENAGGEWDLAEIDKGLLAKKLFGADLNLDIKPWPEISYSSEWGWQGEDPGVARTKMRAYCVGHHIICWQDGGDAEGFAAQLAGKTSKNATGDGKFAFLTRHPYKPGGNRCGYALLHFAAIKVIEADRPRLPPLPEIPQTHASASITQSEPIHIGENKWELPLSIKLPSSPNCGEFF